MKLFVFDVEGTIFKADYKIEGTDYASTMWQPLAHALSEAAIAEERETYNTWENKGYKNYLKWVEDSTSIQRKHSLKKNFFMT